MFKTFVTPVALATLAAAMLAIVSNRREFEEIGGPRGDRRGGLS